MEGAVNEAKADGRVKRFRVAIATIGGAVVTALGVAASPNITIAAMLALVIVLGVIVGLLLASRIDDLEDTVSKQAEKIDRCEGQKEDCRQELASRDVLLAMFITHFQAPPSGGTNERRAGRDRRKMPKPLEEAFVKALGGPDKAESVVAEARRLLSI